MSAPRASRAASQAMYQPRLDSRGVAHRQEGVKLYIIITLPTISFVTPDALGEHRDIHDEYAPSLCSLTSIGDCHIIKDGERAHEW